MNEKIDLTVFEGVEQIGQIAISHQRHATGKTLWVMVLPEGEEAQWNSPGNCPLNEKGVVVFGHVAKGNRKHDWLHHGPWVADLCRISAERVAKREAEYKARENRKAEEAAAKLKADMELLNAYKSPEMKGA